MHISNFIIGIHDFGNQFFTMVAIPELPICSRHETANIKNAAMLEGFHFFTNQQPTTRQTSKG